MGMLLIVTAAAVGGAELYLGYLVEVLECERQFTSTRADMSRNPVMGNIVHLHNRAL